MDVLYQLFKRSYSIKPQVPYTIVSEPKEIVALLAKIHSIYLAKDGFMVQFLVVSSSTIRVSYIRHTVMRIIDAIYVLTKLVEMGYKVRNVAKNITNYSIKDSPSKRSIKFPSEPCDSLPAETELEASTPFYALLDMGDQKGLAKVEVVLRGVHAGKRFKATTRIIHDWTTSVIEVITTMPKLNVLDISLLDIYKIFSKRKQCTLVDKYAKTQTSVLFSRAFSDIKKNLVKVLSWDSTFSLFLYVSLLSHGINMAKEEQEQLRMYMDETLLEKGENFDADKFNMLAQSVLYKLEEWIVML